MNSVSDKARKAIEFCAGKVPDVSEDDGQITVLFSGPEGLVSWDFGVSGKVVIGMATSDPSSSFAFPVIEALSTASSAEMAEGNRPQSHADREFPGKTGPEGNQFGRGAQTVSLARLGEVAKLQNAAFNEASTASAEAGEPVAWRVEHSGGATFWNVESNAQQNAKVNNGTVTPLYPLPPPEQAMAERVERLFKLGDRVMKTKGSSWHGVVVGFYSTELTPIGYCVESEREPGSVQLYPEAALKAPSVTGGVE